MFYKILSNNWKKLYRHKSIWITTQKDFEKTITKKFGIKFPKATEFWKIRELLLSIANYWKEVTHYKIDRFFIKNIYSGKIVTDEMKRIKIVNKYIGLKRYLAKVKFKGEMPGIGRFYKEIRIIKRKRDKYETTESDVLF